MIAVLENCVKMEGGGRKEKKLFNLTPTSVFCVGVDQG